MNFKFFEIIPDFYEFWKWLSEIVNVSVRKIGIFELVALEFLRNSMQFSENEIDIALQNDPANSNILEIWSKIRRTFPMYSDHSYKCSYILISAR